MSRNGRFRPGNSLVKASQGYSLLDKGTWICTDCKCPVAAHINGACTVVKWRFPKISATVRGANMEKGQCGCRVIHYIFTQMVVK